MKKSSHIFSVIFLFAMIFSVVQYLPLTEEEFGGCKTELAKKENDTQNNDSSNDDTVEKDGTEAIFQHPAYLFCLQTSHRFASSHCNHYSSALLLKTTPPPKA